VTYTQIAIFAALFAISFDLYLFNTQLLKRKVFWTSYAIIVGFQLLTNWWLTSRNIVMYSPDAIIGPAHRIGSSGGSALWLCFSSWRTN